MHFLDKNVRNALIAGICGSMGSLFGKLSGGLLGYEDNGLLNVIFLISMISFNSAFWRFLIHALQHSDSTLRPILLSSSMNYINSAFMGFVFFNETSKLLWWTGITLILMGLVLVSEQKPFDEKSHKKLKVK